MEIGSKRSGYGRTFSGRVHNGLIYAVGLIHHDLEDRSERQSRRSALEWKARFINDQACQFRDLIAIGRIHKLAKFPANAVKLLYDELEANLLR